MRMNPRFDRVKKMLTADEVPKFENGDIALCHFCQRSVHLADGYLKLLIRDLKNQANLAHSNNMKCGILTCPRCGSDERYEKDLATRVKYTCSDCGHDYTSSSATMFSSPKMPMDKRNKLIKTLKTKSIRQASIDCGVSYKTAYRMKYLGSEI